MGYPSRVTSTTDETCWTVLRAAARGDDAARAQFFRLYERLTRGYLTARWRGRALADLTGDATQEVFLECLRPDGVLERADPRRGEFRGLLFGVVRNVAARFEARALERGRIRPEDSAWVQKVQDDAAGQATLFDRSWAQGVMAEAMDRLRSAADGDEGARRRVDLLALRFRDGLPIREIAARWGDPAQDVHNAYRKARVEFYRCLKKVVGFHAPASADLDDECRRLLAILSGAGS